MCMALNNILPCQEASERLQSTERLSSLQHGRSIALSDRGVSGGSAALNGIVEKPEEVDEPRRQRLRQVVSLLGPY